MIKPVTADPPAETIWAYTYRIVPPQPEARLREIRALLEREHLDARGDARKWEGRLMVEHEVTHILVVSDSPDQKREVNRRVELVLRQLDAGYSLTAPLAVEDEVPPVAVPVQIPRPRKRRKTDR